MPKFNSPNLLNMPEIKLSKIERIWLIQVLNARLRLLTDNQSTNLKHQRTINMILSKIETNDLSFTSFEKLMCRSCIVEHLPHADRRIAIDADPQSLFSMRNLRDYVERMDMGKDLLVLFGYKTGLYFEPFDFSHRYRFAAN